MYLDTDYKYRLFYQNNGNNNNNMMKKKWEVVNAIATVYVICIVEVGHRLSIL
jgi:hypothetical protein